MATCRIVNGKAVWDPPLSFEEEARAEARCRRMLESGVPPAAATDREFLAGHCNGNQFEKTPRIGDLYRAEAEAAGVDPTGKVYLAGLAAYPGDPRAWVSGRGDAAKVVEERGWDCSGMVNVKAHEPKEPAPYRVADDLVEDRVQEVLAAAPEPAAADREEITEQARESLTPEWAK